MLDSLDVGADASKINHPLYRGFRLTTGGANGNPLKDTKEPLGYSSQKWKSYFRKIHRNQLILIGGVVRKSHMVVFQ